MQKYIVIQNKGGKPKVLKVTDVIPDKNVQHSTIEANSADEAIELFTRYRDEYNNIKSQNKENE
jgi:hypothetical protein